MLGSIGCSVVTRVRGEIDDARMRSYVRVLAYARVEKYYLARSACFSARRMFGRAVVGRLAGPRGGEKAVCYNITNSLTAR